MVSSQGKFLPKIIELTDLASKYGKPLKSVNFRRKFEAEDNVKDVWFTWLIISSDKEVSVNVRYIGGDSSTPLLSIAATALTKEGKMTGAHHLHHSQRHLRRHRLQNHPLKVIMFLALACRV